MAAPRGLGEPVNRPMLYQVSAEHGREQRRDARRVANVLRGQYWPFPHDEIIPVAQAFRLEAFPPVDGAEHFGVRRLAAAFAP